MLHSTTFSRLREITDARFHQLCDELLPTVEGRYRLLTPHGLNERGQSIRGRPDSYVGNSSQACTIAFEYSTQKTGWKEKLIDDVQQVRRKCAAVEEIVVATCVDVDRDRTHTSADWERKAEHVASPASLTVFGGRRIAHLLDTERQDLRFRFLGIPCSRLSAESILASCQRWNDAAIQRMGDQGRYFPARYVTRDADEELYRLWQRATDVHDSFGPAPLIPIVGDSGIGKTSIAARFTESISPVSPVLLLQARDVEFDREEALVRVVLGALQGVVGDEYRRTEEAALVRVLGGDRSLTVLLDGLDESPDPQRVRRAVSHWLNSEIGGRGVIVVTSRPEFWQRCQDASWQRHTPVDCPADSDPRLPSQTAARDNLGGISHLNAFTDYEAASAWEASGRTPEEFFSFPDDVRSELRHPFTLHAAIELLDSGDQQAAFPTRTVIMDRWIGARLQAECRKSARRVSPDILREALSGFAKRVAQSAESWLRIEQLADLPGFNRISPPGEVVEILLNANLLERRDEFGTVVRFTFEAVQDFFVAENEVADIEQNPASACEAFRGLSFTEAELRLDRIGTRLRCSDVRDDFVSRVAEHDRWKAAVVLRAAPAAFSTGVRLPVIDFLCRELSSRFTCRRAKAAELLGVLNCQEARESFPQHVPPSDECSDMLRASIARAAARLSIAKCVDHVFNCDWFRRAMFFTDVRAYLAAASDDFRGALADFAFQRLDSDRRSKQHFRAVHVLAYLRDARLLDHIHRLVNSGVRPAWYETSALLNFDCDRSAAIYEQVFEAAAAQNGLWEGESSPALDEYWIGVTGMELMGTIPRLSQHVEERILGFLGSSDRAKRTLARAVSRHFPSVQLVEAAIRALGPFGEDFADFPCAVGHILDFQSWKSLWDKFRETDARRALIRMAARVHDRRIEAILLSCVEDKKLGAAAIRALQQLRCLRAAPYLRSLLAGEHEPVDHAHDVLMDAAACALGALRDPAAVAVLYKVVEERRSLASVNAIAALAKIRTKESGEALLDLETVQLAEGTQSDLRAGWYVSALVCHGSTPCVEKSVEIASRRSEGAQWLIRYANQLAMLGGWARWRFYCHVDTRPLVTFVRQQFDSLTPETQTEIIKHLSFFDDEPLREFLRAIARGDFVVDGTQKTQIVCEEAARMLAERGDCAAIRSAVDQILNDNFFARRYSDAELQNFAPSELTAELVSRLRRHMSPDHKCRLLRLIGEFGTRQDADAITRFQEDSDPRVANAACESVTRLTDPRLLPEGWV